MNLLDLLQSPVVLVLYGLFILAVLKRIAPNGIDLDDVLQLRGDRDWPRGVQEEEPVRWQVERLHPRFEAPLTRTAEPVIQPNAPART